ncbi:hypothetical protein WKV44_10405 [Spirochaetia bacterium 38H-sp]|uniref:Uncharacterized protein n=1 Tax=Rarispira pelagica TaxID=3141764 RepID=A0ABU9UE77_9SPIR
MLKSSDGLIVKISDSPFYVRSCMITAISKVEYPGMIDSFSKEYMSNKKVKAWEENLSSMHKDMEISLITNVLYELVVETDRKYYVTYFILVDLKNPDKNIPVDYSDNNFILLVKGD